MISVIIPIYNAEDYIHVCLNSILKQTYKDLEVICIDDASIDSTLEILQYFARKDERIKILKNETNKGLNFSKNKGLEAAEGEYVAFLDSHDWFSLNAFETLHEKVENNKLDMILFKNITYNEYSHEFRIEDYYNLKYIDKFEDKIFNHFDIDKEDLFSIPANSWDKFYLKSFLDENKIRFNDEKLSKTDKTFFYNAITSAKRISVINKYLYNKRITLKSTLDPNRNQLLDSVDELKNILKVFLKRYYLYNHYKNEILTYTFQVINENYSKIEKNFRKEFYTKTQNLLKILIKEYWLYNDIKLFVDDRILNKFKFEEITKKILKNQPKISIIIPVYNSSEYLDRCLSSIHNQSLKDIEIICINDGSTDNSLEILEEYKNKDGRFQLFTQKNKGVGFSRNFGIQKAIGEYVLFVDSDDWIEEEMCEKLYNHAKDLNSELVLFNATENSLERGYRERIYFPNDSFNENYDEFIFDYNFSKRLVLNGFLVVWSKMYRIDLVKNIVFQEVPIFEDIRYHIETMLLANRISYLPELLYHYEKVNINSEQNSKARTDEAICIIDVFKEVYKILIENNYFEEFKIDFITFILRESGNVLNRVNKQYKQIIFQNIKLFYNSLKITFEIISELPIELHKFYYNLIHAKDYFDFQKLQET